MNELQARELFKLITTVKHVKVMDVYNGAITYDLEVPGCLLCEGVRHKLYTIEKGRMLDIPAGFYRHFGCTSFEASKILFHVHLRKQSDTGKLSITTGENYYSIVKKLLEKYGYSYLFLKTLSFTELMEKFKSPKEFLLSKK